VAKMVNKKSFTTIQKWESGVADPPIWAIGKLSKIYNVSIDDLYNENIEKMENHKHENIAQYSFSYANLPVGISAGLLEECDAITQFDKISIPDALMGKYARNKRVVIMHVNGESMNNVIPNGSMIAVLSGIDPESLKNGDIVVATNGDRTYTVKRFYNDEENQRIILRPDSNSLAFSDIVFDHENADELKIFGKVVVYSVVLE
jgi:DNA-binding XRE family transcriptional regulator